MELLKFNGNLLCFNTKGICMEPLIKDGDMIIVQAFRPEIRIKPGEIIVYRDNLLGKIVAHRMVKKSINNGEAFFLTHSHYSWRVSRVLACEIIGRVSLVVRGADFINPQANLLSFYYFRLLSFLRFLIVSNIKKMLNEK